MRPDAEPLSLDVADGPRVSALLLAPPTCVAALVLAHGAGAGMTHAFMEQLAFALFARGVASLRYQFPFMEAGGRRPDAPPIAHATVRAAVEVARVRLPHVPLFAGGKSFGGRMTSQAQAIAALPGVRGVVCVGFPLHAAGKPSVTRGTHLADVRIPMLFVQGTRDELADLALLRPVVGSLGERATLHIVDDADHAFHVRKRSGRDDAAVIDEIADAAAAWMTMSGIGPQPA